MLQEDHSEPTAAIADEPPQYTEQAAAPAAAPYPLSQALFFKTAERLLDDVRNDVHFLQASGEGGIVAQAPIAYAQQLSAAVAASDSVYQAVSMHSSVAYVNLDADKDLAHGLHLQTFHGLIAPEKGAGMPQHTLYHYTVKVKTPRVQESRQKHKFYAFADAQLTREDRRDLLLDEQAIRAEMAQAQTDEQRYSARVVVGSIPHIVDSANLYSEQTRTMVRVEISEGILGPEDFALFEPEAVQLRMAKYMSQVDESVNSHLNLKLPSTLECLNTVFRVLKGPLDNLDSLYKKTLKPNSSPVLLIHLDLDMLLRKFFFRESQEGSALVEFEPPHFRDFGDFRDLCVHYFARALQEVLYVGALFAPDPQRFFRQQLDLDTNFTQVFRCLNESADLPTQLKAWHNWRQYRYNPALTTLSCCSYYADALIIEIYNRLVTLDPAHTSTYFDALVFCATSDGGQDLQFHVSILRSHGMVGFGEVKAAFQKLGFESPSRQISDSQILESYSTQLVVCTSKAEKNGFRAALETVSKSRTSPLLAAFLNTDPFFDIADAYELLETSPAVDDDVLITAYQLKAEDSEYYNPRFGRALITVTLKRRSLLLMSFIDGNVPQLVPADVSIDNAYATIGADAYASDTALIRIFQERLHKEQRLDFARAWKSLQLIGQSRHSKLIEGYLSSGVVDSSLLSIDTTPAGLNNIGNTCYLNSLLQYYFVIAPLRELVLKFDKVLTAEAFEGHQNYAVRRIGGRVVGYKETERSYQFMYQLKDLYHNMIHANARCVTPTRELAYLSFSPIGDEVEFDYEEKVEEVAENPEIPPISEAAENPSPSLDNPMASTEQLVDLDEDVVLSDASKGSIHVPSDVDLSDVEKEPKADIDISSLMEVSSKESKAVPPRPPTRTRTSSMAVAKIGHDQITNAFELGRQQDVTECISNVLSQVESALEPGQLDSDNEQLDFVKKLFYGKTKQTLVPVDAHTKEEKPVGEPRTKIERFLNLIVNIGDHPKDIYDALDTYFTEDLLDLDNEEVKRSLTITELPNILQIQIQRVQFDRVRLVPVKSTEPIPFEEKLYMDRYMDTDDLTVIEKRKEVFHWRRRIQQLGEQKEQLARKNEHGLSVKEALVATKEYLKSELMNQVGVLVDQNTLEVLDEQIAKIDERTAAISAEILSLQTKIGAQFEGFTKIGYSIFAIFIHRGQASYGHYWIYIKDFKTGLFRKYNDEVVSEVTLDEVFNFSETNTATPYYLAFVRDDLCEAINPVKRDVDVPVEDVD